MANTISVMIRNVVSKKRRRYKEGGFNLDLAYICPNIIAMGYPAEYIQSVFRNPMNDVCNFFENTHREHYKVYNLRSEKAYDVNKFHGRVSVYAFEDHNPPTIELIDKFCKDLDCWLKADRQNVAAIHCKAGKGRTGTMICCYLLYSGFKTTAEDALAYYAEKRTINKKGVTIPSQRRYVQYYAKLIQSQQKYEQRRLQLCEIRFSSATTLQSQSSVHCLVSTMEEVDCTESRASKVHDIDSAGTWTKVTVKELYKFSIDFRKTNNLELYDQYVTGDVKVELKKFFHFWFNTYFICDTAEYEGEGEDMKLIYNLPKWELDDAHKDKEHKLFPEDFKVQLVLKIVSPNACKNMEVREITQMRKRNHNNFVNSLSHDTHTNSNTLLSDQYAHGEAIPTCSKRDDPTFDVYRNYIHQVENSRKPSNLPSHLSSGDGGSNYMPLLYKQRHPQRQKKRNNETMPSINSELINRPNNLNYNSSHFQQQQQQQIQQQLQQQQFQQQLQQQQQQEQHQQQLQLHHHYYQQPTHHRHQPATVFQDQDKTLHSEHQFQLKQQQQQPQPNKCTSTSSNYIHNTASNSNSSSSSSICSQSSSSSSSGCIGGDGDHRADGCFGEEEDWESGESSTTNFSTTTTTTPTTSSHFSYKRLINSSNDDDDGNSNKKDTYDNDGDNDDGDGGGEDDDDDADDDYDDDDGAIAIKINKISSPFSKGVIRTTSTSNTLHYDSIKTPTTTSVVGVSILDDMYKSFNSSLLMTSPSSLVSNSHRKFETIISSDSKANDDASVLNKMLGSYSLSQTTISPTITVKTNTPVSEMISSNIVGEEKSSSFEKRFHETPNNTLSKVDNQLVPIKTTTKLTTRSKFLKLIKNQGFKAKTLSSVVSSSPVNSSSVLSACAVVQNQLLKKKKLKSKQIPPSKTFQWLHNYFRTDPDFQENLSQQTTIPMGRRSSVSSISGRNYVNSTGSLKKVVGSDKKKSILLGGLDIRGTFHDYCLVDCQSSGSYKTRCSDPNHGNKITDDFSNSNESKTLVDTGRIKIENKSPTGQRQITNKNKHCEIGHSENAAAILRKNNNIITPLVQDTDTLNCDENLMDEESHALNKLSPTALSIPDSNSDSMSMDHLCLNFTNTSLQQQSKLVTPKTRVNDCVDHTTITMYQDHEDYYSSICDNQLSFNNSPCKSPRSLSDILDLKPAITQPIQKCQTGTGNGLTVISSKSNMVPASIIADNNLIKSASLNDTIVVAKPPESHSIGFNVGLTSPTLTTSTTTSSTSRPHTEKYNSNLDYSILESSASNRSQSELSSDSILNLIINHNNFIEDSSNSPVFVDDPLCSKGIDKPKCYGSTSSSSGYCAASEKSQSVSSTSSGIDDTNSSVDITSNPERICFTNIDVDVESKKKFSLPTPEIGSVKIEMTKIRSSSVSSTNNFSSNDNNRDNNLKSSLLPSSSSSGISTDNNEKN